MMSFESAATIAEILVVGDHPSIKALVDRLRLAALSAWIARTTLDVHWLLQASRVRPSLMIAFMPRDDDERAELLRDLQAYQPLLHVPAIFIGATCAEMSWFRGPCCAFPEEVAVETIEHVVVRVAAS